MENIFQKYSKNKIIGVPGVPGVYIKPLTLERYVQFSEAQEKNNLKYAHMLCSASLCGLDGVFQHTTDEIKNFEEVAEIAVSRIFNAAVELNGIELKFENGEEDIQNPTSESEG